VRGGLFRFPFACVIAALLITTFSCDRGGPTQNAPKLPPTPLGKGTVSGTVTFKGEPPPAEAISPGLCHPGATPFEVRPVEVDNEGHLSGVVVFLKGAVGGAEPVPAEPVLLDQVNCVYVPHCVALRTGQTLRVKSSDPTLHNVHALPVENESFNVGMVSPGQFVDKTFATPESFKVKCDVHPWMSASVNVFDHSFYAVTGADGKYEIHNLPPGDHTLVFRHDFLGEVEVKVRTVDRSVSTGDAVFERAK
jgi:plastocyanin